MKQNRMAQQLRALSIKPSLESEGDDAQGSTTDTGPAGEGVVKTELEAPQETQADGAGAPAEDKDLTTKTVTEDEGPKEESAETTSVGDGENVTVTQESIIAVAAISGLIALGSAFAYNKAGKLKNEYLDIAKQIKVKRAQLDHLIEAAETDARLQLKKSSVGNESISKDLENLEKEKLGETERKVLAGISGIIGGALFAVGSPVMAAVSAGLTGAVLLGNIAAVKKAKNELLALEAKLADKEMEIISLASQAEKKGTRVSQESIDDIAGELNAALESETGDQGSDTTTGDGDQTVKVDIEPAQETPADGEGAPGEDQEVTAKTVEVGERSDLETAETTSEDSQDLTASQEGFTGGLLGFLVGSMGWAPFVGAGIHAVAKGKRLKLREDIQTIAKRIAAVRQGQIAQAKKEGLQLPEKLQDVDAMEIIKSALFGQFFGGFYGAWQGSDIENLNNALKGKLKELEAELDAAGISTESLIDSNAPAQAAVAAAAAVAEGAAAAAEAAAAAVDAATDSPAEVVASVAEGDSSPAVETADNVDDLAVEGTDEGAGEMEELEEAIDAGESHAEKYEQEVATLESLIEALEDSRRTGGLTTQGARFFQISFESMGHRLTGATFKNSHGEEAIPSLESFGGTGRRIDATKVSMEAAEGVLKKVLDVLKATWAQIKEWTIKFFEAAFNQAARHKQRADKIIAAAKKASGQPKAAQIKLGGLSQKIAVGSTVTPDNINVLEAIVQEAAKRGETEVQGIAKIRENLAKVGQSADFTALVQAFNIAENSSDLRSAAFKNALKHGEKDGFATDVLPGNFKLFTYHPAQVASSGIVEGMVAGYQLLHGYPVVRIEVEGGPAEDAAIQTLSLAQIISLAERAKKIVEAFENTKKDLKAEALDLGNVQFGENLGEDQVKSLQSIISQITRAVRSSSNSRAKLAKVVISSAGDFLDVAAASLKQYGGVEAADAAASETATA